MQQLLIADTQVCAAANAPSFGYPALWVPLPNTLHMLSQLAPYQTLTGGGVVVASGSAFSTNGSFSFGLTCPTSVEQVNYQVRDAYGTLVQGGHVSASGGAAALALSGLGNGWYEVRVKTAAGYGWVSFGACVLPAGIGLNAFTGMVVHIIDNPNPGPWSDYNTILDALKLIGIGVVRTYNAWAAALGNGAGTSAWMSGTYAPVQAAITSRGMKINLGTYPTLTSTSQSAFCTDVQTLVNTYGGASAYVGISFGNEFDGSVTGTQYAAFMQSVYPTLHSLGVPLIAGQTTVANGLGSSWWNDFKTAGGLSYCDGLAWHSYGNRPYLAAEQLPTAIRYAGSTKHVQQGEYGVSNPGVFGVHAAILNIDHFIDHWSYTSVPKAPEAIWVGQTVTATTSPATSAVIGAPPTDVIGTACLLAVAVGSAETVSVSDSNSCTWTAINPGTAGLQLFATSGTPGTITLSVSTATNLTATAMVYDYVTASGITAAVTSGASSTSHAFSGTAPTSAAHYVALEIAAFFNNGGATSQGNYINRTNIAEPTSVSLSAFEFGTIAGGASVSDTMNFTIAGTTSQAVVFIPVDSTAPTTYPLDAIYFYDAVCDQGQNGEALNGGPSNTAYESAFGAINPPGRLPGVNIYTPRPIASALATFNRFIGSTSCTAIHRGVTGYNAPGAPALTVTTANAVGTNAGAIWAASYAGVGGKTVVTASLEASTPDTDWITTAHSIDATITKPTPGATYAAFDLTGAPCPWTSLSQTSSTMTVTLRSGSGPVYLVQQ